MRLFRPLLLVVGASFSWLSSLPASAQAMIPIEPVVQATILAPGGKLKGCGVRFVGVSVNKADATYDMVDASVNVYPEGYSVVKAGLLASPIAKSQDKPTPTGNTVSWLRIGEGKPLNAKESKIIPADDKGYDLFGGDLDQGFAAISGFLQKKVVWIAFDSPGRQQIVFSGKTSIAPEVARQVMDCLGELEKSLPK